MPNFIVLRLVPPAAVDANTFTTYLNGLTIRVYDVSYASPDSGLLIGTATFNGAGYPPPANAGIVQYVNVTSLLPLIYSLESAATAVIQYVPPGPEYLQPDLRVEFDRGGQQLFAPRLYYDVVTYTAPALPTTDLFQSIEYQYVAAYVTVPALTSQFAIPSDGTPPDYQDLLTAVTQVLAADPGGGNPASLIPGLSLDQCRNIAEEIAFGGQPSLPNLPDSLENMYTSPTNDGSLTNSHEQNRMKFEGQRAAYYGPGDANVVRLTNYIFAMCAALWCEAQTKNATEAIVTFPVNPNAQTQPVTTVSESQVIFTGALGIDVPAAYFYALSYELSSQISPAQRYQIALGADQGTNLTRLTQAVNSGWIALPAAMNPAQAVRIFEALNIPSASSAPAWGVANASAHQIFTDWLAFPPTASWTNYAPGDDVAGFWQPEATAQPIPFLDLVLFALTQGFMIGANSLASEIEQHLLIAPLASVTALAAATPVDWQTFFNNLPTILGVPAANVLPPFTLPGSVSARILAFIAYVLKFFQMGTAAPAIGAAAASALPAFGVPAFDVIAQTIANYLGFNFGMVINPALLRAAAATALPGDPAAQAWAFDTIETLNELYIVSQIPGQTAAFDFSIMEALYARGFTSREEVLAHPPDQFQQALTGTIAYDLAATIYANAGPLPNFPPPGTSPFGPINPGGLTDCIPPDYLSPLGPVAYLSEMLKVSENSTCENPFAPPAAGHSTLQTLIDQRRGPVETLAVTKANLETPLPLIDLVNESLEYLVANNPSPPHGVMNDTASDAVAGFHVCDDHCGDDHECGCEPARTREPKCHKPDLLFGAMPEYSTPAVSNPLTWNKLKTDFSSCCLPYNQPLDVSRTYLEHLQSCRFEEMRTFRKCITEFVLDPTNAPVGFQSHLWRYPVRIDIAIEYLGISREEYVTIFNGVLPASCSGIVPGQPPQIGNVTGGQPSLSVVNPQQVTLPEVLKLTCLTYCEFIELWKSKFIEFSNAADPKGMFPECEPCCLENIILNFGNTNPVQALTQIELFARLYRKLQKVCGAAYRFAELADICTVLNVSSPDFIRQLAAFQMLRDQFRLKLTPGEPAAPGATGADRTGLLALWVGPNATHWQWAVHQLVRGVAYYAHCRWSEKRRAPEFVKLLEGNLDPLSRLAGFDPASATDTWHAEPTHTLRFAEILAKIYRSDFEIGELLYLFQADSHLDGEDPFPLEDSNESSDRPVALPADESEHSIWNLRRKLLETGGDAEGWSWSRIEAALIDDFSFSPGDVMQLGQHFFASVLERDGYPVTPPSRRFIANLTPTNPAMWTAGPFRYDAASQQLWTTLPFSDREVLRQLTELQALTAAEQQAVQDVYFAPRKMLATFAMLFENFSEAECRLIEERDAEERWKYFQRQVARCHAHCREIAAHLARHVNAVTRMDHPGSEPAAWMVLKNLKADENAATASWENDAGTPPPVTWTPNGSAFAALLGAAGTGIDGEFRVANTVVWREIRDSLAPFGTDRNRENCPAPTVIPSMSLALTPAEMKYVSLRNGLAMEDANGRWLGGAQGFEATWSGILMIDDEGEYAFEAAEEDNRHRSWRVVLKRGQKTWVLLRRDWHDEENLDRASLPLRRGAYEIHVEFAQQSPAYLHEDDVHPQRTGFDLRYRGPATGGELVPISHRHLFRTHKDGALSVPNLPAGPAAYLANLYTSSLRDVRRTYQRAFKALLFVHRFALSAERRGSEGSELGYMLSEPANFAGWSYYRAGAAFATHEANFDFNFLPVGDPYFPPAADDRAHPSPQRIHALFDWWERLFDYSHVRDEVHAQCHRHLWLLFEEATNQQPADASGLLRHMCADARHWHDDLRYFQDQFAPVYTVNSGDLADDRWMIRAWHADRWLRRLWHAFAVKDMQAARPDLWASDDPSAVLPGETEAGNANLLHFVAEGCIGNGLPVRYHELRRLNDALRERGRNALLSYLCAHGIVATSAALSEILLIDVRAGLEETASRIEDAITAVQTFIQRARLGLEPGWTVSKPFARLWDSRFATFHIWQACKRRELYKENWVDWDGLHENKIQAEAFLNEQLKRATLTIAEPGGVDYWPDHLPPEHPALCLLQRREPAEMQILPAPREGLNLLATPERDARPSWISTVPSQQAVIQIPGTAAAPAPARPQFPFWMECAIRLGTRFVRVAAAVYPPASTEFAPHHHHDDKKCVTCCPECGCEHPAHVDEYYFWLIDAQYFTPANQPVYTSNYDGQQNEYYDQNTQESIPWHDTTQLDSLLEWPTQPMLRLAWCRVHNGEFQQPRRSVWGVAVKTGGLPPDLSFDGRTVDSLYLSVSQSVTGTAGFRYDMVPDSCEALGNVVIPPVPPSFFGFAAYPYFAYVEPGARLFPWSLHEPAIAVAHALRTHCRFEAALKWYDLVYNPLDRDNRWAICGSQLPSQVQAARSGAGDTSCCDTTDITCHQARHRSVLLHYLDTLLEWGDSLVRRNAPESFQQARLLFDTMRKIMGRDPAVVINSAAPSQTVATFKPLFAPINPRLMMLYERLDDRLALIHSRMSPRRLREFAQENDPAYWGNDPVREGWRAEDHCGCGDDCRALCSPYRFLFRLERAKQLASQTRDLGAALLAAFEKGDAEYLASIRARHDRELAHLNIKVREDQWRDADWQVQALEKSKQAQQSSRRYFANLIAAGYIAHENEYVNMTHVSTDGHAAANIIEGIAEAMDVVPDIFVGTSDFTQLPVGTKLAGLFKTIARITNVIADIASANASLDLTESNWDRRLQDWVHQVEVLDIQIEQTEVQILGAERRRNQALRELNIQQTQAEQATEVLDFLRDKFSNHAVYLFLQKKTADLYRQMYEMARRESAEAQRAFNFERGHTSREFLPCGSWDGLHEGLLAGERLQLDLARMEKEYFDLNCREYELTKHVSLRLSFPAEFLRLKHAGVCEIEIPEWMFDLDYPGQFMRRIRNVSLTIPCVAGPYNEVHCRMTLLESGTRVSPLLEIPAARCCDCCQSKNAYTVCEHDPRWVTQYGALEAIATSSGQNDAGVFEVNFRDDRYLPFEFRGAVSRWRIEMPAENNYFDMDSLTDVIVHLNYTAREGGERLRRDAKEAVDCRLPGDGWCFFDIRHEFPDSWERFHADHRRNGHELDLRLTRHMFPFVPGDRDLFIEKIVVLFEHPEACGCGCRGECACGSHLRVATHELKFRRYGEPERPFRCTSSGEGLFAGSIGDLWLGPLHARERRAEFKLWIPGSACDMENAYLLCRYSLRPKCRVTPHREAEVCVSCGD